MIDHPADRAARLLLSGASPTATDYNALRTRICTYLRKEMDASPVEAEDIADDVLARVLDVRRAANDVSHPTNYILRSARNAYIDRLRQRRRVQPVDPVTLSGRSEETDDDALLRLLDRYLNLQEVQAALSLASNKDDITCLLVVQTWLNLAAERDKGPSSRDVADRLDVAHTTVQRALARFREYVEVGRK